MRFSSASAASVVHSNLSCRLKKGRPRSRSLDRNRFRDAMQSVSFWTSLIVAGASIAMMALIFSGLALIFSGLASIPRLLTMNPSSFPGYAEDTLSWVELPTEFSEAIQGFLQVSDELILGLGFDNNVVNIGFNIVM